ncbi:MAG: AMP-binding protein [Candidatus Hinthialibacter antarcticus]|nr:AMP-binding protein [Candidatus Hinthialibacter antarcticus]
MPILNEKQECETRDSIQQLQLERLQAALNRAVRNVTHYQQSFKEADWLPREITTLNDLNKLPRINRDTLLANQPYGMFAVPLREVVRLHPSASGRCEPIVIGHTQNDIRVWTEMKARGFAAADITQNDMVLVYLDYALFPGAVAAHYGVEQLGACVTPLFNTPIADQIEIMRNYRTTVLICTPSRAVHIVRYMQEKTIDAKTLFLRSVVLVGESSSPLSRSLIEEGLYVDVFENFGVSEICMPGVAFECAEHNGLHLNEDHFLAEIVDPQSGEILTHGERGELTITTLTKEAFPLIRFSTGAITSIDAAACPCGRTSARMAPVTERADDMLIVEGIEFSPAEVGAVLSRIEHATANYRLIILREETWDRVEIEVEITPEIFNDQVGPLEALRERIEEAILIRLRFKPIIKLVEPKSLEGKERVIDKREA